MLKKPQYMQAIIPTNKQQGVVLVVALVMLLIMTVAGVTTMTGATLQERIAGNQRQQLVARTNVDLVLRQAEAFLEGLHGGNGLFDSAQLSNSFAGINDGLYTEINLVGLVQQFGLDRTNDTIWDDNNSVRVPVAPGQLVGRYIIQYIGSGTFTNAPGGGNFGGDSSYDNPPDADADKRKVFRITVMGVGNDTNVVSIVESYFFERAP
jgi:type IV pilus assembly protein PilX